MISVGQCKSRKPKSLMFVPTILRGTRSRDLMLFDSDNLRWRDTVFWNWELWEFYRPIKWITKFLGGMKQAQKHFWQKVSHVEKCSSSFYGNCGILKWLLKTVQSNLACKNSDLQYFLLFSLKCDQPISNIWITSLANILCQEFYSSYYISYSPKLFIHQYLWSNLQSSSWVWEGIDMKLHNCRRCF